MAVPVVVIDPATPVNWGFQAQDIWSNGMTIVGSLATFIVLGIVVAFAPRIISLIKGAITGGGRKRA